MRPAICWIRQRARYENRKGYTEQNRFKICIATSHGQSKCTMVFNLLPLHDIVPNAEIIYFEEQIRYIYTYVYVCVDIYMHLYIFTCIYMYINLYVYEPVVYCKNFVGVICNIIINY